MSVNLCCMINGDYWCELCETLVCSDHIEKWESVPINITVVCNPCVELKFRTTQKGWRKL